jgi:hypothetical protein
MSALLNGFAVNGVIPITDGIAAPAYFHAGLPFEANGTLAVHINATITHYHQGLGFDANGRLSIGNGVTDHFGSGHAPFTSINGLNTAALSPNNYASGVPYLNTVVSTT